MGQVRFPSPYRWGMNLELAPQHQGKFIAYFRVSTDKQGKSGLGLEAQRKAVLDYLNGGRWTLVQEFVEIESGKHSDRQQLAAALAACKKHRAKLVIAKLDRLSRNLAFIAALMESSVEFVAVDNPHANKLTVHILAAVAEHEREMISERTKAALQAAKARGVRLGNPQLAKAAKRGVAAVRANARQFAANVLPIIKRSSGRALQATTPLPQSLTSVTREPRAVANGLTFRSARCCALSGQAPPSGEEADLEWDLLPDSKANDVQFSPDMIPSRVPPIKSC